jgi:hypothetical protein
MAHLKARKAMPIEPEPMPRIVSVIPAKKRLTLRLRWDNGKDTVVNVSGPVNTYRLYAPLRENDQSFRRVRVGEHGADIVWSDSIDMSADILLAIGAGTSQFERLSAERGICRQ